MSDQERPLSEDPQPFVPTGEPRPLPAGEAFKADPNTWYHLEVHYKDDNRNPAVGLMYPLNNSFPPSYWQYQVLRGLIPATIKPSKVKVHQPDSTGWSKWELDDGNWLSITNSGWLWRSGEGDATGWQIMTDGEGNSRLYSNHYGGQGGFDWLAGIYPYECYMGMKGSPFTCRLVPAE